VDVASRREFGQQMERLFLVISPYNEEPVKAPGGPILGFDCDACLFGQTVKVVGALGGLFDILRALFGEMQEGDVVFHDGSGFFVAGSSSNLDRCGDASIHRDSVAICQTWIVENHSRIAVVGSALLRLKLEVDKRLVLDRDEEKRQRDTGAQQNGGGPIREAPPPFVEHASEIQPMNESQ